MDILIRREHSFVLDAIFMEEGTIMTSDIAQHKPIAVPAHAHSAFRAASELAEGRGRVP